MVQMVILNGALVALALYCSYLVSEERVLTVGDFVLLGTYFMQLMTPLNYIGTLYRIIQESFVNMENMFGEETLYFRIPYDQLFVCKAGNSI